MLSTLHIENIAVIEQAEIAFDSGFNVLTGETGAGKSIVIDAISAILGERASREMIRTGAQKAFVSAIFSGVPELPTDFGRSALWSFVNNSFPFLLVGGFALLNGLFLYLLRAPTAAGRVVMDQIDGLELYIRTAETNRMNLAGAPDLTTKHFERLLPYAIALNAEKPWS